MDYGKLTDHNGKNVDFRNVILIMTTNAGASELAKPAIGFGSGNARATIRRRSTGCSRRNSATGSTRSISFAPLAPETIGRVVDKFVLQLEEQLADRNVTIELERAARAGWRRRATTRCSAPGRSGRVIQEHIKKPLAEELLFGKLAKGGTVKVDLKDDVLTFQFDEPQPKEPKVPELAK